MTDEIVENDGRIQGTGEENAKTVGRKLKQAREAAEIHINDMAGRLRLTASQVEALESGRLGQFGAAIYMRGYVANYARQVGLKAERLLAELDLPEDKPPLKAAVGVPPGRRLAHGIARWGSYAAGTVVVLLPIVWWASEGTVQLFQGDEGPDRAAVASIQEPEPASPAPTHSAEPPQDVDLEPASTSPASRERPVLASMTPLRHPRPDSAASAETESEAEPGAEGDAGARDDGDGQRMLVLEVTEDSWVELRDAEGNRLEYDLLRAGTTHRYEGVPPFRVLLGNAEGVQVRYNDSPFDLAPHVQGNLARFQVGEPESPPAGG